MDGEYGLLPESDLFALDEYLPIIRDATADPAIELGEGDEETTPANPLCCGLLVRRAWNTTAQPSGRAARSAQFGWRLERGLGGAGSSAESGGLLSGEPGTVLGIKRAGR